MDKFPNLSFVNLIRRNDQSIVSLTWSVDHSGVTGTGWVFAPTIHKSLSSEYPTVSIHVMTHHYNMLQRNLRFTGVTRRKWVVMFVGEKEVAAIAVKNVIGRRRCSKLFERLSPAQK